MLRLLCVLSAAGLLISAPAASAKPAKGDKLAMLFKKLDTNGDGVLTKEEFSKITELRHKKNGEGKAEGKGSGKHVEALYEKLNTSGDGKLTLEQFRKLAELKKKKNDQ